MRRSAKEILETAETPRPAPSARARASSNDETARWRRAGRAVWVWTRRIGIVALVLAALGALATFLGVRHFEAELPQIAELKGSYHPPQVTRVLARDGALLAELFTERRTVVPIASLPAHVKLAVLAAEDAGFYEHEGLNYLGMLRAVVVNLRAGRTRQGGSTITQQVVKNVLLNDPRRTYARKIREALLARKLEQELTKDEILELYLNHINFGHGRYGIEEAARYNFGKSAKDLTIAEAALLAGLPAGPEIYSPRTHMDRALTRRGFVLGQMHEKGFLNDAQYAAAKDEPVRLAAAAEPNDTLAPEAVEIARRMLKELDPEHASRGGYTITTTIDPRLQAAARKAIRDDLDAYDKRHALLGALKPPPAPTADRKGKGRPPPKEVPFEGTPSFESHKVYVGAVTGTDDATGTIDVRVGTANGSIKLADFERYNPQHLVPSAFAPVGALVRVSLLAPLPHEAEGATAAAATVPLRIESGPEGALVAIDVRTRQVLAIVGSYEAASGGLDRATQARRQPGSTFKPIVYSYAIHSRRYTPSTLVDVNSATFAGGYHPSNYEGWTGHEPLRLREALANSVNVVAVRVLEDVGPANVVQWGASLGIKSILKPDLSLALGSYEVQPIELCGAYATFAAGGEYEEPRLITRIVGPDGKDIPLPPLPPPRRVLDDAESYVVTSMLGSVIDHGTGVRARELHRPLAGKTGTSNQSKDTWFSGYSTEIAASVWIGYDDGKPLGGIETGGTTALPAWVDFMRAAHEHKPPSEFPRPPGVVTVSIDKQTGRLPYADDPNVMDEVYLAGTEPTEIGAPTLDGGTADDGGVQVDP
jgi:penicillin-binding protein 1A